MSDPGVQASIHKNRGTTLSKISNFLNKSTYKDVNLYQKMYEKVKPVSLSYWKLPGGEGAWEQWTFSEIIKQQFTPVSLGTKYGPTWTTHWFKLDYEIDAEWAGREVRLRWKSDTEATVWSQAGEVLQGLSTGTDYQYRPDYVISFAATPGPGTLYIEMVASKLFGFGKGDLIGPTDNEAEFTLTRAEIACIDTLVDKLTHDIDVLHQIASTLDENDPRSYQALYTANQMVNSIIDGDKSGASAIGDAYFSKGNGSRVHTLAGIGNCHIDSAWLWPYSETKRKVARSYSAQLKIMEQHPDYIFVASQAQQFAWLKQHYPELFERVKAKVAEGQFLPVGATWVEMDGNIPSGESFIRQFFYGQKFYKQEFNYTCKEFWLPDTFGYSAQIPALMQHMGLTRFLTQKMSWNAVNKFPHHNFTWEGIDGSTVLAHFPPGDSYTMNLTVSECIHTVKNMRDKGRVSTSAFLFGFGDGGGGPTLGMLEHAKRLKDTDGVPKFELMSSDEMFDRLEAEQHNMMRWVGELYLELHNGTYTSQSAMKSLCRKSEFALRDAEFLLAAALQKTGSAASNVISHMNDLEVAWKKVLLNQFHDVLPGSGIGIIYPEATKLYQEAILTAKEVLNSSADVLFDGSGESAWVGLNTLQWPRREIVHTTGSFKNPSSTQKTSTGQYGLMDIPPFGHSQMMSVTPNNPVTLVQENNQYILDNGLIKGVFSSRGEILSLQVNGDERNIFSSDSGKIGNQIVMYDDEPVYWDAWDVADYHLESPKILNIDGSSSEITPIIVKQNGPLLCQLEWSLKISDKSTMTQSIELAADSPYFTFGTSVDWHESFKILKVLFDTTVLARVAKFDIQFGHLERATHMNTSWDSARYEVCGHKWADISEPDWGLTVLNDCKYGWMGRGSTLALSLLKAPKNPDEDCDMGSHTFKYAIMPHKGCLQTSEINQRAYEFNNPVELLQIPESSVQSQPSWSWGSVEGDGVILHTIKPVDENDGSADIIIRLFESNGCQSNAVININATAVGVFASDGLELKGDQVEFNVQDGVTKILLHFTPFQIKALRVTV